MCVSCDNEYHYLQILENDETIEHPQPDSDGFKVGDEDPRAAKKTVITSSAIV